MELGDAKQITFDGSYVSVQTILLWVLFKVCGVGGSANTTSVFELHRGQENLIKKSTNSISTNQEWLYTGLQTKYSQNGMTLSLDLGFRVYAQATHVYVSVIHIY